MDRFGTVADSIDHLATLTLAAAMFTPEESLSRAVEGFSSRKIREIFDVLLNKAAHRAARPFFLRHNFHLPRSTLERGRRLLSVENASELPKPVFFEAIDTWLAPYCTLAELSEGARDPADAIRALKEQLLHCFELMGFETSSVDRLSREDLEKILRCLEAINDNPFSEVHMHAFFQMLFELGIVPPRILFTPGKPPPKAPKRRKSKKGRQRR